MFGVAVLCIWIPSGLSWSPPAAGYWQAMVLLRICVEGLDARFCMNFVIRAGVRVPSFAIVSRPLPGAPVRAVPSVAAVNPSPSSAPWRYSLLARLLKPFWAVASIVSLAAVIPYFSAPTPVGLVDGPHVSASLQSRPSTE